MIKRFIQFLFVVLICVNAMAQSTGAYNSIATAYVTTTISQNVVFNSAMQQGGTFTFSVLAHNGGGRAGQSDTANVKIQFYTAGGALVSTVNTNYSANLPNPNAVCGNPCIDPAVPWSTLSISTTLSAAQAATVAYAKISMYGIDGSYWAGDYGPWYRAPTFTFNNGANLAYNPEFGPYNGITAQGWTSSPGFGACQGAWGGSNACIVDSSGTPGTSTVGLVANENGGGPDPNGGTTSGTAGGYNSTMSVSSPSGGSPAPAGPTVEGGTITQTNAPTSQTITSGGTSTAGITAAQQTRVDVWTAKTITDNTIYIDVDGSDNSISIVQIGSKSLIKGVGQQAAQIQGDQNTIVINQGVSGTGQNEIDLRVIGSSNSITIGQARNNQGTAVGGNGHYQLLDVYGNTNTVLTQQSNTGGVGSHYLETTITGNTNIITNKQLDNGNKIMFATVNGNNNTATATQQGTGQHYLEYKLTGNNHSATVTQSGTSQNKASIDLTNAGGAATLNLTQGGGMNFSIIQSCAIAAGCTTTVSQP